MAEASIARYSGRERANHWITAISFVLLAASGLAFFHPSFFFLVGLLGGPQWARILHPFVGIFMFASFTILAMRMWEYNKMQAVDREWMNHFKDMLTNHDENLPKVGRYNAGQKIVFWVMVWSMVLMLLTGIVMWREYFGDLFPVTLHRIAVLLHAISAFTLIASVIVHVYAAIWVKGTMRAMTRGTVAESWARAHHYNWYKQMTGKE